MELTLKDTQILKGLGICLMLWHHLFWLMPDYGAVTQAVGILGKVCVSIFLFLSGYGLSVQYRKVPQHALHESLRFLVIRLVKLFFAYWPCFFIVVVAGSFAGHTPATAYPSHLNTYKCLLLDFFGMTSYNSYLPEWWYMRMIVQLYLFFPLLYLLLRRRSVAILSLCAATLLLFLPPVGIVAVDEGGIATFFLGMVCSTLPSRPMKASVVFPLSLMAGGLFAWALLQKDFPIPPALPFMAIAFAIVAVYLCVRNIYHFPVLQYLGTLSGTMYFTHSLFIVLIPSILYFPRFSPFVFLLFLLISVCTAFLISQVTRLTRWDRLRDCLVSRLSQI